MDRIMGVTLSDLKAITFRQSVFFRDWVGESAKGMCFRGSKVSFNIIIIIYAVIISLINNSVNDYHVANCGIVLFWKCMP